MIKTSYWMIERGSPAMWWSNGYRAESGKYVENWTNNSADALHFPNKDCAEREASSLKERGVKIDCVTEHMDIE